MVTMMNSFVKLYYSNAFVFRVVGVEVRNLALISLSLSDPALYV